METCGLYDKALIKNGFQDLEKNYPKLYEYNKVFYWTLLNYFSAYKDLSTGLIQTHDQSLAESNEKQIVGATKIVSKLAGKLPIVGGIVEGIDAIVDYIYGAVKGKRSEDRINSINKIIMFNKDPKAQLDDEINLCIAKAALEVTKSKKEEILNPKIIQMDKVKTFIDEKI